MCRYYTVFNIHLFLTVVTFAQHTEQSRSFCFYAFMVFSICCKVKQSQFFRFLQLYIQRFTDHSSVVQWGTANQNPSKFKESSLILKCWDFFPQYNVAGVIIMLVFPTVGDPFLCQLIETYSILDGNSVLDIIQLNKSLRQSLALMRPNVYG